MVIGCDRSEALVTMEPYNSLKSDIHKDLGVSGGSSQLIIDSRCEDHSENEETILGCTQTI